MQLKAATAVRPWSQQRAYHATPAEARMVQSLTLGLENGGGLFNPKGCDMATRAGHNACFANASMQVLYHTAPPALRAFLIALHPASIQVKLVALESIALSCDLYCSAFDGLCLSATPLLTDRSRRDFPACNASHLEMALMAQICCRIPSCASCSSSSWRWLTAAAPAQTPGGSARPSMTQMAKSLSSVRLLCSHAFNCK